MIDRLECCCTGPMEVPVRRASVRCREGLNSGADKGGGARGASGMVGPLDRLAIFELG